MQILEPNYVANFKCDGQQCNAKCCRHWNIDIDPKTLSKYKHIKPAAQSKEITKHIKKKFVPLSGEKYLISLAQNGDCPFLGYDKLCYIQKTYGESYLSITCRTFPRINFKVSDDMIYRTLSLTCPVAARSMINAPRNSAFHTVETQFEDNVSYITLDESPRGFMLPLINITAHNILRFQLNSLDMRLAVLALFCESANEAKDLKELANISQSFERAVTMAAKNLFAPLQFDSKAFLKEMLTFINKLFTEIGRNHEAKVYVEYINELFEISLLEEDVEKLDFEKLEKIYNEKYIQAKKEFFATSNLQAENFAINYLYMTGIPVNSNLKHFSAAISKYLLEYKMAEFIFVCAYASLKEQWNPTKVAIVAEDLTNWFEHNFSIKEAIDERFKDTKEVMPMIQLLLEV